MNASPDDIPRAFLDALKQADREAAGAAIDQGLHSGWGVVRLYLDVLLEAQRRLGELWEHGHISVADEHLATQITLEQMDRLKSQVAPHAQLPLRAVVAAVEGNEHMVGARAVADFLAMDGWRVDFLGANTPTSDLVDFVGRRRSDLVALSISIASQLEAARQATYLLKELHPSPAVIVGGAGLLGGAAKAAALGADGTAEDPLAAVRLSRKLVGLQEYDALLSHYLKGLGQRLQLLRKKLGWSQAQLAERAKLDRAYVSSVEHGKQNLTVSAITKLASAFGVPLEALLTGEGLAESDS